MLVLLPPSEGKSVPRRGKPLDLGALSHPSLNATREHILEALIALSSADADVAAAILGLGKTQHDLLARNAALRTVSAARADHVYTGVLFEALDLPSLTGAAKRRANASIAIASALFGLLRPGDHIPPYRLSGVATLPGLGPVAGMWRPKLGAVLDDTALLVDLRSGLYANLHKPVGALAKRTVTLRVLHDVGGQRKVVSHFNKATKGRIVRGLLVDGTLPSSINQLIAALRDLGWVVEREGNRLDVVVTAV